MLAAECGFCFAWHASGDESSSEYEETDQIEEETDDSDEYIPLEEDTEADDAATAEDTHEPLGAEQALGAVQDAQQQPGFQTPRATKGRQPYDCLSAVVTQCVGPRTASLHA